MPRIRTVKPGFWDDVKISKVSRDARLLFIGMWNFSDDLGVVIANLTFLKSKIFPYDQIELFELQNWVNELTSMKFIVSIIHNDENFFLIKNFKKHQKINKPNNDDIYIDFETVKSITDQSRNVQGLINEQSCSIHGGIGKEGIGKEGIGGQFRDFSMMEIFYKKWDEYKIILNGQSKFLSEPLFEEWKEFVLFVRDNDFGELFKSKFINPLDWGKMKKEHSFPKEQWKVVLTRILATGIKAEHNLFFRIPQFLEYVNKNTKQPETQVQPKINLK